MVMAQADLGLAFNLMPRNFLLLTKHAGGGILVLAAGHVRHLGEGGKDVMKGWHLKFIP